MRKIVTACVLTLSMLLLSWGCGALECTEPPASYKGAELSGCSGDETDIQCCSYSGSSCFYTLCKDSCNGEYEEESWACS